MAVRRPNGRAVPLYAWWKGQKLGIVEARKQIYIPYLQDLYRQSPIYKQLLQYPPFAKISVHIKLQNKFPVGDCFLHRGHV
jgi:hypothetical protein